MIAALSAAGLPSDRFAFEGFLPAKQTARCSVLQSLVNETRTLIFYEAPHRILETLRDIAQIFGAEREVVIARELTKTFETIRGGPVAEITDWVAGDSNQQRGEIVLLIRGASAPTASDMHAEAERVMRVLLEDLTIKQAASLGAKLTGLKKNFLYQWALDNAKKM